MYVPVLVKGGGLYGLEVEIDVVDELRTQLNEGVPVPPENDKFNGLPSPPPTQIV